MSILTEIKTKIMGNMRRHLLTPADHERPQDDVPAEQITHRIVADYQRMFHERLALIAYIRRMENLYKTMQADMWKLSMGMNPPTRKRMVQELRLTLYNSTKDHMDAQQQLREMTAPPDGNEFAEPRENNF